MTVPHDLNTIMNKVRRITARPSSSEITDQQIVDYINTFYIYDFPEHLRLQNLRVNYQFLTKANQPVYDFDTSLYLTTMPPVFIAGYQSYMTQSRENFFRTNPAINYMQKNIALGNNTDGPYAFQLINKPILQGWMANPPGAYPNMALAGQIPVKLINWMVLISGADANGNSASLVDDGQGYLWDTADVINGPTYPAGNRGTINYITGVGTVTKFTAVIPNGVSINCQYTPYKASRPMSAVFFQDQIALYPIPDQAYTVSFEAYKYPVALTLGDPTAIPAIPAYVNPQLSEWWQTLALGASLKIFEDNADLESYQKFRPILDEQLRLINRRTIVQQTSDRVSTIYADQSNAMGQYMFGNMFGSM